MPDILKVKVVSPNGVQYEGECTFAKLPGADGELGVLPNISPTLAKLKAGTIEIELNGLSRQFFVKSGIGRLLSDEITILTPFLEAAEDIDMSRAQQAKKRAEDRLRSEEAAIDKERARQSLIRAEARLRMLAS